MKRKPIIKIIFNLIYTLLKNIIFSFKCFIGRKLNIGCSSCIHSDGGACFYHGGIVSGIWWCFYFKKRKGKEDE